MGSQRKTRLARVLCPAFSLMLSIAALLVSPAVSSAVDCADYSQYLHWNAMERIRGAYAVEVQGSYAFVAEMAESSGLKVVDISDPDSPEWVATLSGAIIDGRYIVLAETLAYVADYDYGIRVVNIANPLVPVLVRSVPLAGNPNGLAMYDGHLYVAAMGGGLHILSLAVPDNPTAAGYIGIADHAVRVLVDAGVAYVNDDYWGYIYAIDVSDPTAPSIISSLLLEEALYSLAKVGPYLYVAGDYLHAIDVSDPSDMVDYPGPLLNVWGGEMKVAGTVLYMVDALNSLFLYDISSPAAPVFRASAWICYGTAYGMDVEGGYCYAATSYGLYVIETGNESTLLPIASLPNSLMDIVPFGDGYAFGAYYSVCRTYDVSDPLSPIQIGSLSLKSLTFTRADVTSFADSSGNYVLGVAVCDSGVCVIGLENPAVPARKGFLVAKGGNCIAAHDRYAYVTTSRMAPYNDSYFKVVDLSVPEFPVVVATRTMNKATTVSLCGNYAYVGEEGDIAIFDVSDPTNPVRVSIYPSSEKVQHIEVQGDIAYAAFGLAEGSYRSCVQVFDATDPTVLVPQGRVEAGTLTGVRTGLEPDGDCVYAASVGGGVFAIDASDPSHPFISGALYEGGRAALADDHLLLAAIGGLRIGQLHCPAGSGVAPAGDPGRPDPVMDRRPISILPNPVRGASAVAFSLNQAGLVRLCIYDVGGKIVAPLVDARLAAGQHTVQLEAGELSPGVYFAGLETDGQRFTSKLVILR